MPRYEPMKKVKESSAMIEGVFNSKKLTENGIDVLTLNNIAKNLTDNENKVPSIKLLKEILSNVNFGSSGISKEEILAMLSGTFVKNFLNNINKEKEENLSKSNILIDANLTPELVGDDSRASLINSLNEYKQICLDINNYANELLDNNTPLDEEVESQLNSKYELYKLYLIKVTTDIQIATNKLAHIKSQNVLEEANKHTNEIANQIVYKLEIHSTNGSSFKKGTIDTTLNAVLYKGKEVITEQFSPIRYRWTRISHDPKSDEIWNGNVRRDYSVKITSKDVIGNRCTFNCEVLDEDGKQLASAF